MDGRCAGVSADTLRAVPMVIGLGPDIAAEQIRRAGLRPVVREPAVDDGGSATCDGRLMVVTQRPAPGMRTPAGSEVGLTLS